MPWSGHSAPPFRYRCRLDAGVGSPRLFEKAPDLPRSITVEMHGSIGRLNVHRLFAVEASRTRCPTTPTSSCTIIDVSNRVNASVRARSRGSFRQVRHPTVRELTTSRLLSRNEVSHRRHRFLDQGHPFAKDSPTAR